MDIGPEISHERAGVFGSVLHWLKALMKNLRANVIDICMMTKKVGEEDPRRVIHSLKVGLALVLVSLFYYYRTFYHTFGVSAMWAVMTVVVVFEFSVGKQRVLSLSHKKRLVCKIYFIYIYHKI